MGVSVYVPWLIFGFCLWLANCHCWYGVSVVGAVWLCVTVSGVAGAGVAGGSVTAGIVLSTLSGVARVGTTVVVPSG